MHTLSFFFLFSSFLQNFMNVRRRLLSLQASPAAASEVSDISCVSYIPFLKPLCISFLISKERKINIPLILIKGKQASIHFVFNFCYIFFPYIPNSITKKKIYYVLICLLIHVIGLYPVGLPWHEAQGGCEGGGWTFDVQAPLHWEEGGRHPGGGYRNPGETGESPMRGKNELLM